MSEEKPKGPTGYIDNPFSYYGEYACTGYIHRGYTAYTGHNYTLPQTCQSMGSGVISLEDPVLSLLVDRAQINLNPYVPEPVPPPIVYSTVEKIDIAITKGFIWVFIAYDHIVDTISKWSKN
jgi:hypothetical protein